MSDFRESIIIPLAMFERCNFREHQETRSKPSDILYDKTIPSDLKLKLYHQQNKLLAPPASKPQKVEIIKPAVETPHHLDADITSILQAVSTKKKPYADSILSKILKKNDVISWNDKFEVTFNGVLKPHTNIIDLLRFVLGEKVVTSDVDIPRGVSEFYELLRDIGVPAAWMKRPSPRTQQIGKGWIAL